METTLAVMFMFWISLRQVMDVPQEQGKFTEIKRH